MTPLQRVHLAEAAIAVLMGAGLKRESAEAYAVKIVQRAMTDWPSATARPADAPCPTCGKPATTTSCHMGGCPLGADL